MAHSNDEEESVDILIDDSKITKTVPSEGETEKFSGNLLNTDGLQALFGLQEEKTPEVKDKNGGSSKASSAAARDADALLSEGASIDSVGLYLKEMARVPLLSNEEEISLARRIVHGRGMQIAN